MRRILMPMEMAAPICNDLKHQLTQRPSEIVYPFERQESDT
ncbi:MULTISPECIES: hypothetical protein [Neisseria]|nr:hypothetical protein [Neisseria zoodegmatis]